MAAAPVVVEGRFHVNRVSALPMEGRGIVAQWRAGARTLEVYASTQTPHLIRQQLAECLPLDEGCIRVIASDVGGGFGMKLGLYPEDVLAVLHAMALRASGQVDRRPPRILPRQHPGAPGRARRPRRRGDRRPHRRDHQPVHHRPSAPGTRPTARRSSPAWSSPAPTRWPMRRWSAASRSPTRRRSGPIAATASRR